MLLALPLCITLPSPVPLHRSVAAQHQRCMILHFLGAESCDGHPAALDCTLCVQALA
jgi:hypothetical protein